MPEPLALLRLRAKLNAAKAAVADTETAYKMAKNSGVPGLRGALYRELRRDRRRLGAAEAALDTALLADKIKALREQEADLIGRISGFRDGIADFKAELSAVLEELEALGEEVEHD